MTEEQFKWLTTPHGKRPAIFSEEELRREIRNDPKKWKYDGEATCDRFLSDLGIGNGPYAIDGTGGYCHDEKLHPNNTVAPKYAVK